MARGREEGGVRSWALGAMMLLLAAGCRIGGPKEPLFTGEPYLVVWAGDADRAQPDFLAVIDADPTSASYGKVLRTIPVRSRGNEPQWLNGAQRDDRRVFASGLLGNRTFVFDLSNPLEGRLVKVDEMGPGRRLGTPHDYVSLPNGNVAVVCPDPMGYRGDARELLRATGGLVELSADGRALRERPASDPKAHGLILAPFGAASAPALDRLVTTNNAHGYAATAQGERMPGISVGVWRLTDLSYVQTVILDAGPRGEENLGPVVPRFMRKKPMLYVNTDQGGALYASDSVQTNTPSFKLAFDFGADARCGGAAITPDDRFYVTALGGTNRVTSLDLGDPWHPKPVSSVRLDRDPLDTGHAREGGPHDLAMSADGTRIAVADYTVDVPGYVRDGDRRVYMLRLDPGSGRLRIDPAFQDEYTGEVGVDFNRIRWPHGDSGAARPAGVLFVTKAPPKRDD